MQKRLSNTAKVRYLQIDRERVIKELKEYAFSLKGKVLLVLLFGSLAKDTYTGLSDADLLIVVRRSSLNPLNRIPHFMPLNLSVPVEPRVYTKGEIIKMVKEGRGWLKEVLKEGIVLYQEGDFLEEIIKYV